MTYENGPQAPLSTRIFQSETISTPPAPEKGRKANKKMRRLGILAGTAVAAAAIGATASHAIAGTPVADSTTTPVPQTGTSTALSSDGSVVEVAKAVLPSVVQIQEQGGDGNGGTGSGVIISGKGYILTNNHVVAGAADGGSLRVLLNDGRRVDATLVGRDPGADLAVIKVNTTGLTPIKLGKSADLQVGQSVVAVGSPLGLSGTVTEGIVSALNRPVGTGGSDGETPAVLNAIQTDTAINPGNSGGALVNLRGELVGINSAIATLGGNGGQSGSIGLGFAIPVDQASWIADDLIKDGRAAHAILGASVGDGEGGGAVLESIQNGSAAARAGLQQGDVVTKFNDQLVPSSEALVAAIRSTPPGSQVTLTYTRGGDVHTLKVTLGEAQS